MCKKVKTLLFDIPVYAWGKFQGNFRYETKAETKAQEDAKISLIGKSRLVEQ